MLSKKPRRNGSCRPLAVPRPTGVHHRSLHNVDKRSTYSTSRAADDTKEPVSSTSQLLTPQQLLMVLSQQSLAAAELQQRILQQQQLLLQALVQQPDGNAQQQQQQQLAQEMMAMTASPLGLLLQQQQQLQEQLQQALQPVPLQQQRIKGADLAADVKELKKLVAKKETAQRNFPWELLRPVALALGAMVNTKIAGGAVGASDISQGTILVIAVALVLQALNEVRKTVDAERQQVDVMCRVHGADWRSRVDGPLY